MSYTKIKNPLRQEPLASPPANPAEGDTYNDASEGLKIYKNGDWENLASGAENTVDLPEISTPATPAAGRGRLYFKDGKLHQLDDLGNETEVGSGGGGVGGLNLVALDSSILPTDADSVNFEVGAGQWLTYADAAATSPVDMSGGTPNSTFARSTSSPLNGVGSGLLTINSGASRQGEGVSKLVYVAPGYQGLEHDFYFAFETSGTLVEDDLRLFAYDVTNTRLITPFTVSKILGSKGIARARFPIASNCTQLRVGVHVARVSTGALTLKIDDVTVTPFIQPVGLAGKDTQTENITVIGSSSNPTFSSATITWSRAGDKLFAEIRGQRTAVGSGYYRFPLPTGLRLAPSVALSTTVTNGNVGAPGSQVVGSLLGTAAGYINATPTHQQLLGKVYADTSDQYVIVLFGTSDDASTLTSNRAYAYGSSDPNIDQIRLNFSAPIAGWSANVSMGDSSTFLISSYLANGTRVTTTPTKLGEYRSELRQASSNTFSDTNGTPGTLPSSTNGIRLYRGIAWASTDSNNEPSKYTIFVGKNKSIRPLWYRDVARTGNFSPDVTFRGSQYDGYSVSYDPSTGLVVVVKPAVSAATSTGDYGFNADGSPFGSGTPYFDIQVSENALGVGAGQPRSEVSLANGNGHGSTNTKIRRFSTILKNEGTAITYSDSATAGASFTINEDGVYSVSYTDTRASGTATFGVSVNSNQLTTNISAPITSANIVCIGDVFVAGFFGTATATLSLSAGDVIRPHTEGNVDSTSALNKFRITKVSN
jgi:hypothetical protein